MNDKQPRIRAEVQVMFFDTDCGGVVSNIAYLRFIEIARTLLAEELGLPLAEMAQTQRYPVVVKTEIDYKRGAKLGDKLVIDGWLDDLQRARFWCAFRITRPSDQSVIAECRQMLALIEMPAAPLHAASRTKCHVRLANRVGIVVVVWRLTEEEHIFVVGCRASLHR